MRLCCVRNCDAMTVAYPYFRFLIDRENNQAFLYYYLGVSDAAVTTKYASWRGMGNGATKQGGEGQNNKVQDPTETDYHISVAAEVYTEEESKMKKCCPKSCCGSRHGSGCLTALYVILAVLIVVVSLALIALSVTSAVATKIFSSDMSGRLVAHIILAVTAAVAISIAIAATVGLFKKKVRPVHVGTVVLLVVALIQALIAGISVKVSTQDESQLTRSLVESFRSARDGNPRQQAMWSITQHDLNCCGIYSSEDYRRPGVPPYFPPDVPISCCPSYDPDRSELSQERAREICKSRQEFYQNGCKTPILTAFQDSASWVLATIIILIVLEVCLSVLGAILTKREKLKNLRTADPEENQKTDTSTPEK